MNKREFYKIAYNGVTAPWLRHNIRQGSNDMIWEQTNGHTLRNATIS
jgi:hypothetical protein